MNAPIFNRDFVHPADSTYMIEPAGEHPNLDNGFTLVVDAPSRKAIVNRFNADADAGKLSHGNEMVIDRDHFKHISENDTTAYGWLQKLENRDDGIYGKIRWTNTGKAAVDGGDYRFFSTEYDPNDLQDLSSAPRRVRPVRLDGLTLTNMPRNNKGAKPITNKAGTNEPPSLHPAFDVFLQAVSAVQDSIKRHTNTAASYGHAWKVAKQLHPEKHAAAFNPIVAGAENDLKQTAQAVTEIANRVGEASGGGSRYGRIFLRQHEPQIFTAMRMAVGVDAPALNRSIGKLDIIAPSTVAAKLFNRLVAEESKQYGILQSHAFARVCEREPVLKALANGEITCEQAFARDPLIRNRLT